MVYLKPRQDLNILAPPLPLPTLFSCFSTKMYLLDSQKTPDMCLYDCMKPLQPFLSFSRSPSSFFPSLPSAFVLLLLQSCATFQPPALSLSHNHSCRYSTSSLHPGKHRPQTWAVSLVSMILPRFTCFTIYANLTGSLCICVCVFVSFPICLILLLIFQHAEHKCVMSTGMFDLCYLSDKENYSLQMQSVTGKDSAGTTMFVSVCVCMCASSRPIIPRHVFYASVCVCGQGV